MGHQSCIKDTDVSSREEHLVELLKQALVMFGETHIGECEDECECGAEEWAYETRKFLTEMGEDCGC